jgi:hypothetical protein
MPTDNVAELTGWDLHLVALDPSADAKALGYGWTHEVYALASWTDGATERAGSSLFTDLTEARIHLGRRTAALSTHGLPVTATDHTLEA